MDVAPWCGRMRVAASFAVGLVLWIALVVPGLAAGQGTRSRPFGPGRCGPADPTAIQGASYTGGQPYFLSPSEIGQSARLISETAGSNVELVLWASATSAGHTREYSIPVDASIERLVLSASFDAQGGRLLVPDIAAGTLIEETILNCIHLITIERPAPGTHRVQITGTGRFWFRVHARSPLSFSGADFVEAGGRPGHEGLFRIYGQPVAGRPATLRVSMSETGVATRNFAALSMEGRVLQSLELADAGFDEFVGSLVPPAEPFRVVVTGEDTRGFPYQRLHGPLFHAQPFEIVAAETPQTARAGELTPVSFVVRNYAHRARYHVVGTAGASVAERVDPRVLDLEEGAESTVTVWIPVPADATGQLDVRVTATREDDAARFNSAVRRLTIAER